MNSDEALQKLRELCFSFPAVDEKLSHGAPTFFVKASKTFASFADDHHGDGRTAAWVKATVERQQELVEQDAERYFVPPYVGKSGWVGVHLGEETDWDALLMIIEDGWVSVAPKSAHGAKVSAPPTDVRPKTDPTVAAAALARVEELAAGLEGAVVEREKWHATLRIGKRPFAYFVDNHHGDGHIALWVWAPPGENAAAVSKNPKAYFIPPYRGKYGWLAIELAYAKVSWKDVAARLAVSFAEHAPKPKTKKPAAGAGSSEAKTTKVKAPRTPSSRR